MSTETSVLQIKDWLVDFLPYEVMWLNKTGQIIYANAKFCSKLGYKESEITRLSIFDLNPTTTEQSWAEHWALVEKESEQGFRAVHKNKKGVYYEVEVFAQFFSNNGKNLICSIVRDITESSFYRSVLDSTEKITHVGGWKMNVQDGSLIVTNEVFEIFGTQEKEDLLPGKVIHFFEHPEQLRELLSGVMRKAIPIDVLLPTHKKLNKVVRVVAKPIMKGKRIYEVVGAYQDVTLQQENERSLNLIEQSFNYAQDMIFWLDKEAKMVKYNRALSRQLGYSSEELAQMDLFDIDPTFAKERFSKNFDYLRKNKRETLTFEANQRRKDGTYMTTEVKVNFLEPEYAIAVVRDISERKKRKLELINALEEIKSLKEQLQDENLYLQEEINEKINFGNIICKSEAYNRVLQQVNQVAPTDTSVLITGESGTGKELLASAVHGNSRRKDRPLIKVNCATLPKELIESELFGHKKGAFTGATEDKTGKFLLADGGTILLDEIGELPLEVQPKLLRVLQEGEFDLLGGVKTIKVDVRVIASTNRDLETMIKEGTFREDLFYRLNVFPIYNIPLRSRKEDIPLLAQYFLEKYSAKAGKSFKRLSKKAIAQLMAYGYPGNIRELENLIERAVIIENGNTLHPGDWMPKMEMGPASQDFKSLETVQRDHIIAVLNHTNWRVSGPKGAALLLNVKDKTLFAKMKRLGIQKKVSLKS